MNYYKKLIEKFVDIEKAHYEKYMQYLKEYFECEVLVFNAIYLGI